MKWGFRGKLGPGEDIAGETRVCKISAKGDDECYRIAQQKKGRRRGGELVTLS